MADEAHVGARVSLDLRLVAPETGHDGFEVDLAALPEERLPRRLLAVLPRVSRPEDRGEFVFHRLAEGRRIFGRRAQRVGGSDSSRRHAGWGRRGYFFRGCGGLFFRGGRGGGCYVTRNVTRNGVIRNVTHAVIRDVTLRLPPVPETLLPLGVGVTGDITILRGEVCLDRPHDANEVGADDAKFGEKFEGRCADAHCRHSDRSRPPLELLQGLHATARLLKSWPPPRDTGTTWSHSKGPSSVPQ